jgi:hypothetical protein
MCDTSEDCIFIQVFEGRNTVCGNHLPPVVKCSLIANRMAAQVWSIVGAATGTNGFISFDRAWLIFSGI